ncbi:MAG: hypothetical protein HY270_20160 [Deltaproteobacteria bacterium]|nr:hypothetical protein [Deltaproteobacteria bacterium]
MQLADFYFAHDELFVVPIEHLSSSGMSLEFQDCLQERRGIPAAWNDRFNKAFGRYWERAKRLAERDPRRWPPPRLQHCCIITAGARVRPYFQPFNNSAWLLYQSDFDPQKSSLELSAYLFLHMERMGLVRDVTQAVLRNLGYWLVLDDAAVADFAAGCRLSARPDAAGFRAIAEALPWIRNLYDTTLKPPPIVSAEPLSAVPLTGLLVPRSSQPRLDGLLRRWAHAAQASLDAFHAAYARRGRDHGGELCAWLREAIPQALITGADGRLLWDPAAPGQVDAVRKAVAGIAAEVAGSLRADLDVLDRHSRRFLGSLTDPQGLPPVHCDTTQSGLTYMHRERRSIAYNLLEPDMERLRVPAPPYERWMLGARTIHEWGHLAVDAGWVPVAAARRAERDSLIDALTERFEQIVRDAPPAARGLASNELQRLAARHGSYGRGLAAIPLTRMPDYQANLLARRYLSRNEMETYVRNNIYCLSVNASPAALFQRLARYAYEYQYLLLSAVADARRFFLSSTWFEAEYVGSGILRAGDLDSLLRSVGGLCAVHGVDETKFLPLL